MTADVPTRLPLGCIDNCPASGMSGSDFCENCATTLAITGVRYAWSEAPCCGGGADRAVGNISRPSQ